MHKTSKEDSRQQRNPSPSVDFVSGMNDETIFKSSTMITNSGAPLEVESSLSAAPLSPVPLTASWRDRLNWLQGGRTNSITENSYNHHSKNRGTDLATSQYYDMGDGIMKITRRNNGVSPDKQQETSHSISAYPFLKQASSSFSRVASWFSPSSHNGGGSDDASSMADFDPSDWTPPDSSYGAAIPVAGWIPKPIRRTIEGTLIALGIVALVYMVVTTSMRVTNERSNKDSSNSSSVNSYGGDSSSDDRYYRYSGGLYLDDDLYVTYGQDKYHDADDDDEEDGPEDEKEDSGDDVRDRR